MISQDCGATLNPIRKIGSQYIEYINAHTKLNKTEGDWPLRPCLELADYTDAEKTNPVTSIYAALGRLKAECPELSWGEFRELTLTTQSLSLIHI